jgi:hypothetical protein
VGPEVWKIYQTLDSVEGGTLTKERTRRYNLKQIVKKQKCRCDAQHWRNIKKDYYFPENGYSKKTASRDAPVRMIILQCYSKLNNVMNRHPAHSQNAPKRLSILRKHFVLWIRSG